MRSSLSAASNKNNFQRLFLLVNDTEELSLHGNKNNF